MHTHTHTHTQSKLYIWASTAYADLKHSPPRKKRSFHCVYITLKRGLALFFYNAALKLSHALQVFSVLQQAYCSWACCKSVDMVRKENFIVCDIEKGGIYVNIYLIWNHKKQCFMNWKTVGHHTASEPELSGSATRTVTHFRLHQAIKLNTLATSHILLVETVGRKYTENGYLAKIKSVSHSLYSAVME